MRIAKGETEDFESYFVFKPKKIGRATLVSGDPITGKWKLEETEHAQVLENVIEADDESGLVVTHLSDFAGNMIYTDGRTDLVIDNTARLLMFQSEIRLGFLEAGFRPKVTVEYVGGIRIGRKEI